MKKTFIYLLFFISFLHVSASEYHVSKTGSDLNDGTANTPFLTIQHAVGFAQAGDTITVHAGVYRERINPLKGGTSNSNRILYRAAPNEKVEIKGSEIITGWEKVKGSVWKKTLANSFFGDYNPFKDIIHGDWFFDEGRVHHTADVFLNGKSLYEMETLDKVYQSKIIKGSYDEEGSTYTWYCESDKTNTTIWANFQKYNPNEALIEVSSRKTCIYPTQPGINYLTIRGFHISQAATQWAAPTAGQVGMVSTHWNKGWIIENNVISNSRCNGITLGKEFGTGHNVWTADEKNKNRDGSINYIEVIFNVLRNNWDKAHIGSHIVRNNTIFNCEQTAICGSMGAVYSTIENNHIYNIYTKRQFNGYEMAGIKLHAPVDVLIKANSINNCGHGIWLDWMTQGTRLTQNLLYKNSSDDLYIEVNHGPYIVDHNIMLSYASVRNLSQGGAYINNLIGGRVIVKAVTDRFTPYFLPHSLNIAGLSTIQGGDDRFYNNIFLEPDNKMETYLHAKQDSWIEANLFFEKQDSIHMAYKTNKFIDFEAKANVIEKNENVFVDINFIDYVQDFKGKIVTTSTLGITKLSKSRFDNPDGSDIMFNVDYFGEKISGEKRFFGPFHRFTENNNNGIKVWSILELL
ncbi:right-handed parallel beta-helix repeat-containing protein [Joostella atrarenae]|uniref:Right-handed parallel beta-helix repeat-containing protein n=1 Tax=Joostella atrarenae TaxID=679257 RepID=A0ABS9J2P9_9FLAO|nr:right-handed parallel beta-helix repeat-containing protein [Joostella atrarenae]MCF8714696.1 right-handed parallel beta-helix repeat-containing protein [Joostella atrarenae]